MNTENRDFVIERLERQLKEKEAELDDIKTNLRESILREIRSDLKNDLDFHNRIVQLERKVQSLSSNLNGIMDELLDQKSMLRSLGELSVPRERKVDQRISVMPPVEETTTPKVYRPEPKPVESSVPSLKSEPVPPSQVNPSVTQSVPKDVIPSAKPINSRVSVRSDDKTSVSGSRSESSSSNVHFNIREVPPVKQPEMSEPAHRSEYIIAETDDERKLRLDTTSRKEVSSCNYIVAEEDKPTCQDPGDEYETVEAREDEDAVVVTTRRK
ncbi:hypothetical protein [Methanolobus sp.]|jgi:hypothetical protein|uniref:hypothetical protein n=1 Tax=Methanolobus sp. TaxID=1874737 RepID=UPI0025E4A77A|nr:hypothetical protein [Methanolobus sp.]